MLIKNYEPETVPVNVIDPQLLAKLVVSGGRTVNVVAEFAAAVRPSGTSSHIVYTVITDPASPFDPCVPLLLTITRMKVDK